MTWWQRRVKAPGTSEAAERLNHFHSVMSRTNRLILSRPEPAELFETVCRLCVDARHMHFAVVNMPLVGEAHRAHAEASTEALTPELLLEGARLQALLAALVAHADNCIIIHDATTDERVNIAKSWCEARRLFSFAALPIRRSGALIGTLILGSRTKAFFDGGVVALISELGADLSFALDNADLERARQDALQADQVRRVAEETQRARSEFLARTSHELRTPLNAMLGFAQLLATDKVDVLSATQAERVRLIAHAGWHVLGLVNDALDLARVGPESFDVVNVSGDISSVLDEALALAQPLGRNYQVEVAEQQLSPFGIGATVDPRRLLQVLLNLLSNACKYNRPGGHVWVDVTFAGAEVCIDVVDDGVGMTADQLEHLYEPFNRLGHEGAVIEGSGIGLALARHLVERMNGRLNIMSTPDKGTRARVTLPSYAIPLRVPDAASSFRENALRRGSVVLYIEDDPVNRILVAQMLLRIDDLHVLMAETGKVGLAMARHHRPDLILLDMDLPDTSGLEMLKALRRDPRTELLDVVAVSANAGDEDKAAAAELGALDYWTKPLHLESFLAGVSRCLQPVQVPTAERQSRDLPFTFGTGSQSM